MQLNKINNPLILSVFHDFCSVAFCISLFRKVSKGGRKIRTCPICHETFVNVTHHAKKHKNVPKQKFFYDSEAKAQGYGQYSEYNGYQCHLCKRSVLHIKDHFKRVHTDIDPNNKNNLQLSALNSSYQNILESYQQTLVSSGVAKRNSVSRKVAKSYVKQVSGLIISENDLSYPNKIYERLQQQASKPGADSTKYAFLATLQNFLQFIELHYISFHPVAVKSLQRHVNEWLQRQRKKKEKRSCFVKEQARKKLDGLQFPRKAIKKYMDKYNQQILQLMKMPTLSKTEIETLYAHVFVETICNIGCRPGVLTGFTCGELNRKEVTKSGMYSVLVEKQKELKRHGCIVFNKAELNEVEQVSKHAWSFLKKEPLENDPVFPSLVGGLPLSNPEFSRIFGLRVGLVFQKNISPTDIRKLITTHMRNQPAHIQSAVAQAEGHTVDVAQSFYNISHPYEVVEKARRGMEEVAGGMFRFSAGLMFFSCLLKLLNRAITLIHFCEMISQKI